MRYDRSLFFVLIFKSIITTQVLPQQSIKMEFGNGTSSLSNFSIKVQDDDNSFQIDIKRLRSNLRDLDMQFEEGYNNEFIKMLLNLASVSGDEISIIPQNNEYLPTIDVGKLTYSLNDWDIHIAKDGPVGSPTLSAKASLQRFKFVPPRNLTKNMSQDEWNIFRVFFQDGSLSIKKLSVDIIVDENSILNLNAQIDLPVGKANINSKLSIPSNLQTEPYIESTEINLTSLTPGLREIIDEYLVSSNEIPIRKKGTGYQLRFRGELDNPRFY